MLPKSGTQLPKSKILVSGEELAGEIAAALQCELGASRRAQKTVMAWTGVSERTARQWLNGVSSPTGCHLVTLAANCRPVIDTVLKLAGYEHFKIAWDLAHAESALEAALTSIRDMKELHRGK